MASKVKSGTWGRDASLTRRSRARIAQGAQDVEKGLQDTERRGIPSDIPTRSGSRKSNRDKAS